MEQLSRTRRLVMVGLAALAVLAAATVSSHAAYAATPLPNPGLPVTTKVSATSIAFSWTAPAGPVLDYTIQVVDVNLGPWHDLATTAGTAYTHSGLTPETVYLYRVVANPTPGSGYTVSYPSPSLYEKTSPLVDTTPPTKPVSVVVNLVGPTYATIAATMSTDNDRIAGYSVQRQVNGVWTDWATSTGNRISLSQLAPSTTYTAAVVAFDPSGNRSPRSDPVTFTTRPLQAGPTCRVQRQVVTPTNFILNMFVENLTATVLTNWSISFTMPAAQSLNYSFNGTFSHTGDAATLTPLSFITTLNPGTTAFFGINANRPADSPLPSGFTLNGAVTGPVACTVTAL